MNRCCAIPPDTKIRGVQCRRREAHVRGRGAAQLRQDGAGHRRAAARDARWPARSRPHRPALRPDDVGRSSSTSSACRAPDHMLEVGSATHAVQTARVMERIEPVLERRAARPRARSRRRQLDARRGARRGQARHPAGPRRGRAAQLRPHDARGDQPDRRRRVQRLPVHPLRGGEREPARGGHRDRARSTSSATR